MVVGEHEKFASALISPNFKCLEEVEPVADKEEKTGRKLIELPAIISAISKEVEKINLRLNPHERILRFRLVPDEWTPSSGELSPTLKLKRQVIAEKYRELLDQVYRKQ